MQTQILIGLFICHWLADYTHLSTGWMLSAKRLGKPLTPIFVHALMHSALMTLFITLYYWVKNDYNLLGDSYGFIDNLFLIQLITHFAIDVWKGKMNNWFPALQSPANKWHWIVFGFDQLLHALVIIGMSYYACK